MNTMNQDVYDSYDLFEGHYYDNMRSRYPFWQGPPRSTGDAVWSLDLASNDLVGKIPPEVGYLAGLEHLVFSDNPGIVGPFPPEMWNLAANLESLDLSDTRLSGTLPEPDLGCMEDQILHFSDDWLDDAGLHYLNLSNCRFTGDMPRWLPVRRDHTFNHTELYLSGNNWTGADTSYSSQIKDSDKIPSLPSRDG